MSDKTLEALQSHLCKFIVPFTKSELGGPGSSFKIVDEKSSYQVVISLGYPSDRSGKELIGNLKAHEQKNFEKLEKLGVQECIECGCCDVVCPSHIPLAENFRKAKHAHKLEIAHAALSKAAQKRYEIKTERLLKQHADTEQLHTGLKADISRSVKQSMIKAAVDRSQKRRRNQ